MGHVVLFGDSIFDNERYVPDRPPVIAQLCRCLCADALGILEECRDRFAQGYRTMLGAVASVGKPTAVCTIYNAIPHLGPAEKAALGGFNEIILRAAFEAGLPVIDLRLVCGHASDFSHLSPIEPSMGGGLKIARAVAEVVVKHDFAGSRSVIYF